MKFFERITVSWRRATSIIAGTDFEGTIEGIRKNVTLRRANIWMLFCSTLIACIGLDTNSTAVIIGAMLISPLMSPILGVGLSVGIQEKSLLASSLKNLLLATGIAIGTSFFYFSITPLAQPTSELTSRITPTILDVGIGFFGGVAGIVAGSRKEKTTAIPGVAIATALMPPVCTAGFGLATHRMDYFFGAFYLYFINAVFIAFATYVISLWLGFPRYVRKQTDGDTHIKASIVIFVILVIVPSGIIFKNVLAKLRFDQNVKSFVNTELRQDLRQPLEWSVLNNGSSKELKVFIVGKPVGATEKQLLEQKLKDEYSLNNLHLDLIQLNLSPEEITKATSAVETSLSDKLALVQSIEESQKEEFETLKTQVDVLRENTEREVMPLPELIKILFPPVMDAVINQPSDTENAPDTNNSISIVFQKDTTDQMKKTILAKIERIAKLKLNSKNVVVEEIVPVESSNGQSSNSNVNSAK